MRSRDSGLPLDTRNSVGTAKSVFESLHARERPFSALFENSQNWASSSCALRPGDTGKILEHGKGEPRAAEFVNINPTFYSGSWNFEPFVSHWKNLFS